MARKTFFSFHYKPDCWRASQVRNMGAIEGNTCVSDNDWETIAKGGDNAIQKWIEDQLQGRTCSIVLIGENTANRKWINYEIIRAWDLGKGVLGIYIHNLKDVDGKQDNRGNNPFDYIGYGKTGKKLSTIVKAYEPPYTTSTYVYDYIKNNIADWVENAIETRGCY